MSDHPEQTHSGGGGISMPRGYGDVVLRLDHGSRVSVCHACNDFIPAGTDRVLVASNGKRYKFRNGSRRLSKWFLHVGCVQTVLDGATVKEKHIDHACFHCEEEIPENARTFFRLQLKAPYVRAKLCFGCAMLPAYRFCAACCQFHLRRNASKLMFTEDCGDDFKEEASYAYICDDCHDDGFGISQKVYRKQQEAERVLQEQFDSLVERAEKGEFFDG